MRLRFKSMLTFIFLLIVACIAIGIGYVFYVEVISDESVVVVDGDITINFLNGNEFSLNDDGVLEFTVTNNSSNSINYYIQISEVKGNIDNVVYELKSNTNDLNVSNTLKSEIISNSVVIEGNKTDNYEINFKTDKTDNYSGKIIIGMTDNKEDNFANSIMKNNVINETILSNMGESSLINEGLIKSTDDLGDAYYFRGVVDNNYVSFAGLTWRIVKINGDNSVKLVLDGLVDVLNRYYENSAYNYDESTINTALQNWYTTNLVDYSDFIANYKYCNDLVHDETKNIYEAYNRIAKNKIPTFVCLGAEFNSKIGLLTADEVMLAGASLEANESYYLYNKDITSEYFTMTSAKATDGNYHVFTVNVNGSLSSETAGNLLRGVRPVINIIRNASVSGTGTTDDPYMILSE